MRVLFFIITVLTTLQTAIASEEFSEEYLNSIEVDCWDVARTQMELNACASFELQDEEETLNIIYKKLVSDLEFEAAIKKDESYKEKIDLLKQAQKNWFEYRNAQCNWFNLPRRIHGSISPMTNSMCRTGLTKKRIIELIQYLECDTPIYVSSEKHLKEQADCYKRYD